MRSTVRRPSAAHPAGAPGNAGFCAVVVVVWVAVTASGCSGGLVWLGLFGGVQCGNVTDKADAAVGCDGHASPHMHADGGEGVCVCVFTFLWRLMFDQVWGRER